MKFDAYAGNVYTSAAPVEVAEAVAHSAGDLRISRARPRSRYADCWEVKDAADSVGWLGHDGHLGAVYFEFKGVRTGDVAGALRRLYEQKHTASRVDSCDDWNAPGAFDSLVATMDRSCDPRVRSDMIAPRNGDRGRTFYWGSPASRVRVRVYEKGKMAENLHLGRPDWARAEVQVRPKSQQKAVAALVTPLQAWGFAGWTQKAAEALGGVEVPRYAVPTTPNTHDRTTLYLARAHRRFFEENQAAGIDWLCFGREVEEIWAEDDAAAAALRALQPGQGRG